ncbi:MAG: polysaccharide lyase [Pseudomonadota bacterium]
MKRRLLKLLPILAVLGILALGGMGLLHNRMNVEPFEAVVTETFEDGSLDRMHPRIRTEFCCEESARIVDLSDYGSEGQGIEVSLRPDDADVKGSKRSEIRLPAGHFDKVVWYRTRIRIEPDWVPAEAPVTLLQWHGVPDKALLEGNRSPALRLLNWKNQNYIALNWDTSPRSFKGFTLFGENQGTVIWLGDDAPGEWEDWVFRVVWARRTEGRVSVWRNGELLTDHIGYAGYNDLEAPYLKVGIYVPKWKDSARAPDAESRTAQFDDVWEIYPEDADGPLPDDVRTLIDTLSAQLTP